MAFILRSDYTTVIDEHILSEVLRYDETRLATAEQRAVSFATGHLNNRFDTERIFVEDEENEDWERHPLVLMHTLNICLYYLHQLIAPDSVPQNILDNYLEAKDWFEKVSAGTINPPDLPAFEDGERDYVRFGGNTRRENHL
jgi:hypothetical protein